MEVTTLTVKWLARSNALSFSIKLLFKWLREWPVVSVIKGLLRFHPKAFSESSGHSLIVTTHWEAWELNAFKGFYSVCICTAIRNAEVTWSSRHFFFFFFRGCGVISANYSAIMLLFTYLCKVLLLYWPLIIRQPLLWTEPGKLFPYALLA